MTITVTTINQDDHQSILRELIEMKLIMVSLKMIEYCQESTDNRKYNWELRRMKYWTQIAFRRSLQERNNPPIIQPENPNVENFMNNRANNSDMVSLEVDHVT